MYVLTSHSPHEARVTQADDVTELRATDHLHDIFTAPAATAPEALHARSDVIVARR